MCENKINNKKVIYFFIISFLSYFITRLLLFYKIITLDGLDVIKRQTYNFYGSSPYQLGERGRGFKQPSGE